MFESVSHNNYFLLYDISMSSPHLDDLIQDFLEYCEIERGHSELTIRNYEHYLIRFLDFLQEGRQGAVTPKSITIDKVRSYRLFLNRLSGTEGEPMKRITQNYHLIAIRAFLKYLAKRDIETLSPEKIELIDAKRKQIGFLDANEVEALLSAPRDNAKVPEIRARDEAILELLFSTGLRVSELCNLDRGQVNTSKGEVAVRGKGGKDRVVFISPSAAGAIGTYLKNRKDDWEPLFIHYGGAQESDGEYMRLTTRSVQRLVTKYASLAGITKKVTPHILRHSFATDLLFNGADLRSVQEMLGHSSITTTQMYTHVTNKQLKEVHSAFHGKRNH
jgi:site-specific recombinase XerD